jgi:hypothetical protein
MAEAANLVATTEDQFSPEIAAKLKDQAARNVEQSAHFRSVAQALERFQLE